MRQEQLNKLTEALEGAGFELAAFREEVYVPSAFQSGDNLPRIPTRTGKILIELEELQPSA
jgi:hypothetical protein